MINKLAFSVIQPILRWFSIALFAFALPAHAVTFDAHWDGDWDTATGIINGTFVVQTLPFPVLSVVADTNTNLGDWFGNGGDSLHFTHTPGAAPPPFGGFTPYGGTFQIVSGTGNYAGATGSGSYMAYSIPDPGNPGILKISGFEHGTIQIVPEPSTNALLLTGTAAVLGIALRARRRKN